MNKIYTFRSLSLTAIIFTLATFQVFGQVNRSIDGVGNNIANPEYGAVGTNQLQITDSGYEDGISTPGGVDRPNPRFISNNIFSQEGSVPDVLSISDYAFVWGQFIDHDVTLCPDTEDEHFDIPVPMGDVYFDPFQTGTQKIELRRTAHDLTTGTSVDNPRAFPNHITSYIDASNVYGSDIDKANWLRTFNNGKLKSSAGNMLPYNTISGEIDSATDVDAPEMAMPFDFINRWFIAGDVRANENALLTSIHTIFAREHNLLCDELAVDNPDWTDEEMYQRVRKIVGAKIQAISFNEWLPTLGLHLPDYTGYDATVNAGVMNVFSVAAYRYGHTVINSQIIRMDNQGNTIPEGNILLRDAFFNPSAVSSVGLDPYLIGMGTQVEQDFDCKMIDDLRNFLFGPPGSGGLDLSSINIQRGRERGLPDYNTIRTNFGLPLMENFENISNDALFTSALEDTYTDINLIDPWVGFLGESHMTDALFGETVMEILTRQFSALRDGDRYYYYNDDAFTDEEKAELSTTTLKSIIMRNTGVLGMQDNVFVMAPHVISTSAPKVETLAMSLYPNPADAELNIVFNSEKSGETKINIFDLTGRVVLSLEKMAFEGANTLNVNVENIPTGIYNVNVISNDKVNNQRIVIERK